MNVKRLWAAVAASVMMLPMLSPVVRADTDYSKYNLESAMSSAYYESVFGVEEPDEEGGGSEEASSEEQKEKAAAMEIAYTIVDYSGGFGQVGLFYGGYESTGVGNVLSSLRSPLSAEYSSIQAFDSYGGGSGPNYAEQYRVFGYAKDQMLGEAAKKSRFDMNINMAVNTFVQLSDTLLSFGFRVVKMINPGPLMYAMYDSSVLNDDSYADNILVKGVKRSDIAIQAIKFLGDPSGIGSLSFGWFLAILVSVLSMVLSTIFSLWHRGGFAQSVRKTVVRFAIASFAIPVAGYLLSSGLNYVEESVANKIESADTLKISNSLNFADWYATGFSMPAGDYKIVNGKFQFSGDQIRELNRHTTSIITGVDKGSVKDSDVANRLDDAAASKIRFSENVRQYPFVESYKKGGNKPFSTKKYYEVVNALGSLDLEAATEALGEKGNSDSGPGYIKYVDLTMTKSGSGDNYVLSASSDGMRPGMSRIAAYNLMRTTFSKTGFGLQSNVGLGENTAVAINMANGVSSTKTPLVASAPLWTTFIAAIVMMFAAVKGMTGIFVSGVGASIKGAGGSAVGRAESAGELFGGVLAIFLGVFGVSALMSLIGSMLDVIWGLMNNLLFGEVLGGADGMMDMIFEPIIGGLRKIPFGIGDFITSGISSMFALLASIILTFALPQFLGIPIKAFCQWVEGIPASFAARARQMTNRFTGDYQAGGGPRGGGGFSQGMGRMASDKMKPLGDAAKALGVGAAGYGIGKLGQKIQSIAENTSVANSDSENSEDTQNVEDPTNVTEGSEESVTSVEEPPVEGTEGVDDPNAPEGVGNPEDPKAPMNPDAPPVSGVPSSEPVAKTDSPSASGGNAQTINESKEQTQSVAEGDKTDEKAVSQEQSTEMRSSQSRFDDSGQEISVDGSSSLNADGDQSTFEGGSNEFHGGTSVGGSETKQFSQTAGSQESNVDQTTSLNKNNQESVAGDNHIKSDVHSSMMSKNDTDNRSTTKNTTGDNKLQTNSTTFNGGSPKAGGKDSMSTGSREGSRDGSGNAGSTSGGQSGQSGSQSGSQSGGSKPQQKLSGPRRFASSLGKGLQSLGTTDKGRVVEGLKATAGAAVGAHGYAARHTQIANNMGRNGVVNGVAGADNKGADKKDKTNTQQVRQNAPTVDQNDAYTPGTAAYMRREQEEERRYSELREVKKYQEQAASDRRKRDGERAPRRKNESRVGVSREDRRKSLAKLGSALDRRERRKRRKDDD